MTDLPTLPLYPTSLSQSIRVLAFDPSIGDMGFSIVDYVIATGAITIVKTGTLNGAKLIKYDKVLKDHFSKPFCILQAYKKICSDLIIQYKPDYVASEGAFHFKFPQVLVSLSLVIHTIRTAAKDTMMRDIYLVAPMETKKEVTGSGTADKEMIRESLLKFPLLTFETAEAADLMSEHEFDAVGHAICFIRRYLPTILASAPIVTS